jgi:hypothetical protein
VESEDPYLFEGLAEPTEEQRKHLMLLDLQDLEEMILGLGERMDRLADRLS